MRRVLTRKPARPLAAPVVGVALAAALSACGAGFEAQTYQQRPTSQGTNTAVGALTIRNIVIEPGRGDGLIEAGDDADVRMTLTNEGPDDDRLVEVVSPDAAAVDIVVEGENAPVDSVELPRLSTTGTTTGLVLRSLEDDLRPGEYAEITLRFERNGEATVLVPVGLTGEYDEDRERSENFHPVGEHAEDESGTGGRDEASEEQGSDH